MHLIYNFKIREQFQKNQILSIYNFNEFFLNFCKVLLQSINVFEPSVYNKLLIFPASHSEHSSFDANPKAIVTASTAYTGWYLKKKKKKKMLAIVLYIMKKNWRISTHSSIKSINASFRCSSKKCFVMKPHDFGPFFIKWKNFIWL